MKKILDKMILFAMIILEGKDKLALNLFKTKRRW